MLYRLLCNPEFIAAVAWYLKTSDIQTFNPGAIPPLSADKKLMINESKSGINQAIQHLKDVWPADLIPAPWLTAILKLELEDHEEYRSPGGGFMQLPPRQVGAALKSERVFKLSHALSKKPRYKYKDKPTEVYILRDWGKWKDLGHERDAVSQEIGKAKCDDVDAAIKRYIRISRSE